MDKSETAGKGSKSIITVSVYSTPENAVKLVHEEMLSAPMRDSKALTETFGQDDWKDRFEADNGACRQGASSQPEVKVANEGASKLLTAECIQNWSETFVVENCRQVFHLETLLLDTQQVLEVEIHFFMSEHSIVQTEVNLNYTMTETKEEHISLAFATSKQFAKHELNVIFALLQETAEATNVKKLQPHAQQANLFLVTTFYADNLLLEQRNKCFELDKSYGFVHEQQIALQEVWNGEAMYQ